MRNTFEYVFFTRIQQYMHFFFFIQFYKKDRTFFLSFRPFKKSLDKLRAGTGRVCPAPRESLRGSFGSKASSENKKKNRIFSRRAVINTPKNKNSHHPTKIDALACKTSRDVRHAVILLIENRTRSSRTQRKNPVKSSRRKVYRNTVPRHISTGLARQFL